MFIFCKKGVEYCNSFYLFFFAIIPALPCVDELIGKVPPTLHTPLMSGANAISGITLLASIVLIAEAPTPLLQAMGAVSLAFALFNVVGGFLVTDRMLAMFRRRNDQ